MQIINGKHIAQSILDGLKGQVKELPFQPVFCDVLVGQDPASVQYVNMKRRAAERIGLKVHRAEFPGSITTSELIKHIEQLNVLPNMCGLIVQLPLPAQINKDRILNSIRPEIDVDVTGQVNSEKFYSSKSGLVFPTAAAIMAVLDSVSADLRGYNFLIVGQGMLVGRPVAHLLKSRGYKVQVATRDTQNTAALFKTADVIVSAAGEAGFIKGDMIKPGAIVIDAGTSESESAVAGDADIESVSRAASYFSPVPGGVGPVTVAMLLSNVVKVASASKL